jgi:hypothetical protein
MHKKYIETKTPEFEFELELWCLKPLSTIFQLYHGEGLCPAQHETNTTCHQGKVEQVYLKSKGENSIWIGTDL